MMYSCLLDLLLELADNTRREWNAKNLVGLLKIAHLQGSRAYKMYSCLGVS